MCIKVDWIAFGERVHMHRRRFKFSQTKLAQQVGISRNYLSMIERGIADPSYVIVMNLCHHLKIDPPPIERER